MDTSSTITKKMFRETKYCRAIQAYLAEVGHATNAMILESLQSQFPNLSATTVHRATTRLSERGNIGIAPSDVAGAMRYDADPLAHDHFMCKQCGVLRDTTVGDSLRQQLESDLEGCHINGPITVSALCKQCAKTTVSR